MTSKNRWTKWYKGKRRSLAGQEYKWTVVKSAAQNAWKSKYRNVRYTNTYRPRTPSVPRTSGIRSASYCSLWRTFERLLEQSYALSHFFNSENHIYETCVIILNLITWITEVYSFKVWESCLISINSSQQLMRQVLRQTNTSPEAQQLHPTHQFVLRTPYNWKGRLITEQLNIMKLHCQLNVHVKHRN